MAEEGVARGSDLDAVAALYDETAGPSGVRLAYVSECFRTVKVA